MPVSSPTPPADRTMPISQLPPADRTMPISSLPQAERKGPAAQADLTMPISSQQADETMPFRVGTGFPTSGAGTAYPTSGAGTTYPASGGPSGVGGSGGSGQPFGSRPGSGGVPSAGAGMYGSGTGQSGSQGQLPDQGTVYGGLADYAPADMTMPVMTNSVENSGSLTGHILSQGWREQQAENHRKNNTKVIVAMLIVLGALVGVSLLFVFTVGSAFSDLIGGVFK
jgi:hypothetical protein